MNSEEKKLHDIGIADFVLTDLMLYLDTHPSDQKAMEYFNHYARSKHRWSGNSPEIITHCARISPKAAGTGAGAVPLSPGKEAVTDVEL